MNKRLEMYLAQFGLGINNHPFTSDELEYIDNQLQHRSEVELNKFDVFGNYNEELIENFDSPYLDEFVLKKNGGVKCMKWPDNKPFAVCLTHDVDRVVAYSPQSFLRDLKKRLIFSQSSKEKFWLRLNILKTSIKSIIYKRKSDDITGYEKWVQIEQDYGVKSTYFFFVRPPVKDIQFKDCDYLLEDEFLFDNRFISVKEYIKILLNSGHEIGLHGSFKSMLDKSVFQLQKRTIESIIKQEVVSTRQHYLRYNHQTTPEIHIESNIEIDSSLGLNMFVGFRNGSSYPYPIEVNGKYLWELPLIFMDSSIYRNSDNNLNSAKKKAEDIINKIEKTGGCLTINFHPDYVNIPDYINLYRFILDETKKRNAYFGTAKEIINIARRCVE